MNHSPNASTLSLLGVGEESEGGREGGKGGVGVGVNTASCSRVGTAQALDINILFSISDRVLTCHCSIPSIESYLASDTNT